MKSRGKAEVNLCLSGFPMELLKKVDIRCIVDEITRRDVVVMALTQYFSKPNPELPAARSGAVKRGTR